MSDLTFQKDFPERFVVKDELSPKDVARATRVGKAFWLLVIALGPIFIILAYFVALEEGGNLFIDDKYREVLIFFACCAILMLSIGVFMFKRSGKEIKRLMEQPFVFVLTHKGIVVNRISSETPLEIPWRHFKKFISFRVRATRSGAPTNIDIAFRYEDNGQTYDASVRPLTLSKKDLKYVKKYIAAFAPDDAYIDIHNVVDLRQKFGLTS